MSLPVGSTNYLIHDANGKPQVIKIVTTGKGGLSTPGTSVIRSNVIKSSPASTPVRKILTDDDTMVASNNSTLLKSRFVTSSQSGTTYKAFASSGGSITKKTIQLTPTQLQAITSPQSNSATKGPAGQQFTTQSKMVPAKAIMNSNQKRPASDADSSLSMTDYKRRRADKLGKGLRHFSMKVCEKVRQKGTTSYNEVADELVAEFTGTPYKPNQEQNYDQKNIRRRVYDALNVLMAMNIISKEKKEIRWIGLPTTILEANKDNEREKKERLERIEQKTQDLQQLILQQIAFKNLVERNRKLEEKGGRPAQTAAVQLPFLVVNTSRNTMVNCSVSNDKTEYLFNFDDKFEIQDDMHVLKGMGMMMGLDNRTFGPEDFAKARKMVPRSLEPYVVKMCRGDENTGNSSFSQENQQTEYLEEYLEEDSDLGSDAEMDLH